MAEQAVKSKRLKKAKEVQSQDKQNPKTTQIQFRVSVKDKRQLEARVKASGKKKLSNYLLELGLNASEEMVEKVVEKIEEDSELINSLWFLRQSLIHVGNNLNQLLKKSNTLGFLLHSEQRQVVQLSQHIEALCQEIKEKL